MNINDVELGKEYIHKHAYGQPDQRVRLVAKRGNEVKVIYVSDDGSKGMHGYFNEIECERYLKSIPQ